MRCSCCLLSCHSLVTAGAAVGFWPTYKSMDLALPSEMVEGISAFKEFYEAETKHRKLTWVYTQVWCCMRFCWLCLLAALTAMVP